MPLVWYFAYGSNMQRATFSGRRGITPQRALAARVFGWRLVLDKPPLISMGQSFANLVPDETAAVYGVLYEVSSADYAHVEHSEGVALDNYRRTEVVAEPLHATGDPVGAYTLVSTKRAPDMRPSRRYVGLLIDGAEEHRLPAEYIEFLRALPAREERGEDRKLRHLLDEFMKKEKPR